MLCVKLLLEDKFLKVFMYFPHSYIYILKYLYLNIFNDL